MPRCIPPPAHAVFCETAVAVIVIHFHHQFSLFLSSRGEHPLNKTLSWTRPRRRQNTHTHTRARVMTNELPDSSHNYIHVIIKIESRLKQRERKSEVNAKYYLLNRPLSPCISFTLSLARTHMHAHAAFQPSFLRAACSRGRGWRQREEGEAIVAFQCGRERSLANVHLRHCTCNLLHGERNGGVVVEEERVGETRR